MLTLNNKTNIKNNKIIKQQTKLTQFTRLNKVMILYSAKQIWGNELSRFRDNGGVAKSHDNR
jgi:hypothetical protein